MRLEFEKWIENQNIPSLSKEVLKEAVICYKVSAYRAALLLSFSGLQIILKSRISTANKPNEVAEKKWFEYNQKISADDVWDTFLSNNIIPATDSKCKIFDISEDLISQHGFWKNRRNDAAHSKDNRLTHAHIEAFWQFIESNLPKFVIIGSQQEILNKIKIYFDLNETSRSASYDQLIVEIPNAVETRRIKNFFEELKIIVERSERRNNQKWAFWNSIIENNDLVQVTMEFLQHQNNHILLYKVIQHNPKLLGLFQTNEAFLRKIYKKWLFKETLAEVGDFEIINYLITHNIIPGDELNDIITELLYKWYSIYNNTGDFLPEGEILTFFKDTFFPIWESDILENLNDWDWANSHDHRNEVADFLALCKLNVNIVRRICEVFSRSYYPYGMNDTLNSFFGDRQNSRILDEFISVATMNDLDLPKSWHLKKKAERNKQPKRTVENDEESLDEI